LRAGSDYLLVQIDPPVTTKFWDGPSTAFDQIILAIVGHHTTQDVGTKPVMAHIVICPSYLQGVLDEKKCSKIGTGGLHATYAEAVKNVPHRRVVNNLLDDLIAAYVQERSNPALTALYKAILTEKLEVPISEAVKELQSGRYDVPVVCVRTDTGAGAIPAFTTEAHLLKWKPQGCLYTTLTGRSLLAMAIGMEDISEVIINLGDAPRGRIPRADFERMLALP
jgi:hypothetical protein